MLRFIILFFGFVCLLQGPLRAEEPLPLPDEKNWLSLSDYMERNAFSTYGPPLPEEAQRYKNETQLYEDMVDNFYAISDDEDELAMVIEAFSVPVSAFRPASFRPDGAIDDEDEFADDPLPEQAKSSSIYVDQVRPSFLPGGPLKPRALDDVKLGDVDAPHALFEEQKKPDPKAAEQAAAEAAEKEKSEKEKAEAEKKKAEKEEDEKQVGQINAPKKPENYIPHSDEETLRALQQAVRELGLQKQLNFEPNQQSQTTTKLESQEGQTPAPEAQQTPAPATAPPKGALDLPASPPPSLETKETAQKIPADKPVATKAAEQPAASPPVEKKEPKKVAKPSPAPQTKQKVKSNSVKSKKTPPKKKKTVTQKLMEEEIRQGMPDHLSAPLPAPVAPPQEIEETPAPKNEFKIKKSLEDE